MQTQKLSRLELYVEILKSLETLQTANLLDIQEKTSLEQAFLKQAMSFLETQGLVKKTNTGDKTIYESTLRGDRVAQYFRVKSQEVPPQEETSCTASNGDAYPETD